MHCRKETNHRQTLLECVLDASHRFGCERVDHEKSDESIRMPPERGSHRSLIPRHACYQRRARHAVMIELRSPSICESFGRTRAIPPEQGDGLVGAQLSARPLPPEPFEELLGKEMTVSVVDH